MFIEVKRTYYNPREIGEMLGVSRQSVIKLIQDGRIPGHQTKGGHWRIPADVIQDVDGNLIHDRIPVSL